MKCPQCNRRRPRSSFLSPGGQCAKCREKYRGWHKLTPEEKMARREPRKGLPTKGVLRVRISLKSSNRKTGPIPVSITSANTCPPSCSWFGAGCYAENHLTAHHWRRTVKVGLSWEEFCSTIAGLPAGQIWRHNEAGDLPGQGEELDYLKLQELVEANRGRRGFTYTHKKLDTMGKKHAVRWANLQGFTINMSSDNLAHADELYDLGVAPVTTVLEHDAPKTLKTPRGRVVRVCPAEYAEKVTCEGCGWCANPDRIFIVGFRAHGDLKYLVSERVAKRPNLQLPLIQELGQQLVREANATTQEEAREEA